MVTSRAMTSHCCIGISSAVDINGHIANNLIILGQSNPEFSTLQARNCRILPRQPLGREENNRPANFPVAQVFLARHDIGPSIPFGQWAFEEVLGQFRPVGIDFNWAIHIILTVNSDNLVVITIGSLVNIGTRIIG